MSKPFGIGVIGMGWMGTVHSRAFRAVGERFPNLNVTTRLTVCADEIEKRALEVCQRYGFEHHTHDWQRVVSDPDTHIVCITAPNQWHLPIVQAACEAGKHVFCEKPVGRNSQETFACQRAAAKNPSLVTGVGYNYRWPPVVQYAKQLIQAGDLGQITHYRGRFLVDYGSNPDGVLSWRFRREVAGWGVLGDIMSHVIDMAHFLVGPLRQVISQATTFIPERPLPKPGEGTHFSVSQGSTRGTVTNEDYVSALIEFQQGAHGTLEVSRVVTGHDCEMAFEVNGTEGTIKWNYERLNELKLFNKNAQMGQQGTTRVLAGPDHPCFADFYPGPGNSMGYEDLKLLEAAHFCSAVDRGTRYEPDLTDAASVAQVQSAMQLSWSSRRWQSVEASDIA